jgi:hypothetical protein
MSTPGSQHVLRRALIGGYRVSDVEVALATLTLALSQLELELDATRKRLLEAERLAADGQRRAERARRVEVEAAETVRRLRLQRQQEEHARAAQVRIEAAEAEAARQRDVARAAREPREIVTPVDRRAPQLDRAEPDLLPPPAPTLPDVFGTAIELDAGPFGDLASLTQFEQSLHSVPGVTEVYIRRFEAGRATMDVTLQAPSPLLQEMTDRLPYRLDVESTDASHISMTVQPAAMPA